jgi:hypothetical protein
MKVHIISIILILLILFLHICTVQSEQEALFVGGMIRNKNERNRVPRTQVRSIPPLVKTCAILAKMVYQPSKVNGNATTMLKKTLEAINKMGTWVNGYNVVEATNDYAAFVHERRGTVIIAITGTRFGDIEGIPDMVANSKLLFKQIEKSARYKEVAKFIDRMRMNYGTYRFILTGHSLGASLAEAYGRNDPKVDVVSFCSPGTYDLKELDTAKPTRHQNIYSYTVEGDLVSFRNTGGREYSILKKDNQPETVKGHHTIANFVDDKICNIIREVKDSFKK